MRSWLLTPALLLMLANAGCELVADFDRSRIPGSQPPIGDGGLDADMPDSSAMDGAMDDAMTDAAMMATDATTDATMDAADDAAMDSATDGDAGDEDGG